MNTAPSAEPTLMYSESGLKEARAQSHPTFQDGAAVQALFLCRPQTMRPRPQTMVLGPASLIESLTSR